MQLISTGVSQAFAPALSPYVMSGGLGQRILGILARRSQGFSELLDAYRRNI